MNRQNYLTARETEVLQMMASGRRDKEIATELGISHRTVSNRVSVILLKLDARSRTEAVALGIRSGILDTEVPKAG
jgi:DNA-binding NarL/FixJ family response regulator